MGQIRPPARVSNWKVVFLFLFSVCVCSFVLLLRMFECYIPDPLSSSCFIPFPPFLLLQHVPPFLPFPSSVLSHLLFSVAPCSPWHATFSFFQCILRAKLSYNVHFLCRPLTHLVRWFTYSSYSK